MMGSVMMRLLLFYLRFCCFLCVSGSVLIIMLCVNLLRLKVLVGVFCFVCCVWVRVSNCVVSWFVDCRCVMIVDRFLCMCVGLVLCSVYLVCVSSMVSGVCNWWDVLVRNWFCVFVSLV